VCTAKPPGIYTHSGGGGGGGMGHRESFQGADANWSPAVPWRSSLSSLLFFGSDESQGERVCSITPHLQGTIG